MVGGRVNFVKIMNNYRSVQNDKCSFCFLPPRIDRVAKKLFESGDEAIVRKPLKIRPGWLVTWERKIQRMKDFPQNGFVS